MTYLAYHRRVSILLSLGDGLPRALPGANLPDPTTGADGLPDGPAAGGVAQS